MLKYISFRAYEDELETRLNEYAQQGYQVTTCEPVIIGSADHLTVSVSYIIIMARYPNPTTPEGAPEAEQPEAEGIPMKG